MNLRELKNIIFNRCPCCRHSRYLFLRRSKFVSFLFLEPLAPILLSSQQCFPLSSQLPSLVIPLRPYVLTLLYLLKFLRFGIRRRFDSQPVGIDRIALRNIRNFFQVKISSSIWNVYIYIYSNKYFSRDVHNVLENYLAKICFPIIIGYEGILEKVDTL